MRNRNSSGVQPDALQQKALHLRCVLLVSLLVLAVVVVSFRALVLSNARNLLSCVARGISLAEVRIEPADGLRRLLLLAAALSLTLVSLLPTLSGRSLAGTVLACLSSDVKACLWS